MALILKSKTLYPIPITKLMDINPLAAEKLRKICQKGLCRINSAFVSDKIEKVEFVEGIVILENGFCFEHFWNKIGNDHIDVSAELIETEDEKANERRYYPIHIFPNEFNGHNDPFLSEVKQSVREYYETLAMHKKKYDEESNTLRID